MNPVAALLLVVSIACVLHRSRRVALFGIVFGALFIPQAAALEPFGFNVFPTRLITAIAFFRVLVRRELSVVQLNPLDRILLLLYAFTTAVVLLHEGESFPLRIARLIDAFTTYFAIRAFVRDIDDLRSLLFVLAILFIPYSALLAVEFVTHASPFKSLGARGEIWVRGERMRCFGSFRHPSLLGSLGAIFFPLFVGLAFNPAYRRRAAVGAFFSGLIVLFSNSGGPLSTFGVGMVGWALWFKRTQMKLVRRASAAMIVLLALVMKAPIWYLVARVSSITGGTGWHRAFLMDVSFRNIDKWWLIGMPVVDTRGWFPYSLAATGGSDITNQFIGFGLNAGLAGMVLFIVLFVRCFQLAGNALREARRGGDPFVEPLVWGCGVAVAAHMFNFLGITYFDQFYVFWFLQLAALASVSDSILSRSKALLTEPIAASLSGDTAFPNSLPTMGLARKML